MLSSRQMGVLNCVCNSAWSIKSSYPSGCSIIFRSSWSRLRNISRSSSVNPLLQSICITRSGNVLRTCSIIWTLQRRLNFSLTLGNPWSIACLTLSINASALGRTGISAPTETLWLTPPINDQSGLSHFRAWASHQAESNADRANSCPLNSLKIDCSWSGAEMSFPIIWDARTSRATPKAPFVYSELYNGCGAGAHSPQPSASSDFRLTNRLSISLCDP